VIARPPPRTEDSDDGSEAELADSLEKGHVHREDSRSSSPAPHLVFAPRSSFLNNRTVNQNTMARTRSIPQATAPQVPRDEDEVDYGEEDTDLTDVSELERQLNGTNLEEPPSAQRQPASAQVQVSGTPQAAATKAAATADTTVTLTAALVASMTNSLNALATHLGTLHGSHSAQTASPA
jgi:hypothetical protein